MHAATTANLDLTYKALFEIEEELDEHILTFLVLYEKTKQLPNHEVTQSPNLIIHLNSKIFFHLSFMLSKH